MSTSIIKLHVFSGAQGESPPCYMLQVDEFNFLLDCGWNWQYQESTVAEVAQCARMIDAVLLSHSTTHHLGALAFLVGQCGLHCPIYSTTPVFKMGQLALYDAHQGQAENGPFPLFTLDHVDAAFDLVRPLKYQQNVTLLGKGQGIVITPLPAGNSLGGTIWKIMKDDYMIVYAIDYNHKKERHLNGALFDACLRPHLLITDTRNALYNQTRRRSRDETLLKTLMATLRRGGNVLLAVDTAARCLELAHLLQQLWHNQESGLMAYGLAFLNYVAFNVLDFARSQVEWMSDKVMRSFEDHRSNPFGFRHMQVCHSMEALANVPEPRVVLASQPDLESGFARQLFYHMCEREQDLVILTEYSAADTLARKIVDLLKSGSSANSELRSRDWSLNYSRRVPLTPQELEEEKRTAKAQAQALAAGGNLNTSTPGNEAALLESDSDDSDFGDTSLASVSEPSVGTTSGQQLSRLSSISGGATPATPNPVHQRQNSVPQTPAGGLGLVNVWTIGQSHHGDSATAVSTGGGLVSPVTWTGANTDMPSEDAKMAPVFDVFLQGGHRGIVKGRCVRGPMLFPCVDKKHHCDSYGEKLDPAILQSFLQNRELFVPPAPFVGARSRRGNQQHGKDHGQGAHDAADKDHHSQQGRVALQDSKKGMKREATGTPGGTSATMSSSNNAVSLISEGPVKYVKQSKTVHFKCQILFIDFEGCSDGDAMRKILTSFRPQEVILVRGSPAATTALAEHCRDSLQLATRLVHCPNVGDTVDCTKETHIYQATIRDSLVSSLKFFKIRDYELAWIDASVHLPPNSGTKRQRSRCADESGDDQEQLADDDEMGHMAGDTKRRRGAMPILELPSGPVEPHATVFVNEPKLSDLKTIFLKNGLNAEFFSGVLIVNGCVAVKRTEAGKLLLEGALSNTYHTVRDLLFAQFAIL